MRVRLLAPARGLGTAILVLICAGLLPVITHPTGKAAKTSSARTDPPPRAVDKSEKKPPKEKTFDFNNLQLNGQLRTPQLLYFLERANEELERASLEKRSFIPHIVRSVEDESL